MTASHRGARVARVLAYFTPALFLVGMVLSSSLGGGAVGAGLIGTLTLATAAALVGWAVWGRLDLGIGPVGIVLWLIVAAGLIAFVVTMAVGWRDWTF